MPMLGTLGIGSGRTPKASVSSTTGSPTTSANGGATCYKFTGSGSITISQAGIVRVRITGAGGGGNPNRTTHNAASSGGGGGGVLEFDLYLDAGTYTVTVGAGGTPAASGGSSKLGSVTVPGGGTGGNIDSPAGQSGACTGGTPGAGAQSYLGFGGSTANPGGGGGMGSAGSGTTGGSGVSSTIRGTSSTVGAGGNSGGGAAGTANTGNGGAGGNAYQSGGNGGSGVVDILVGTV